jgi:hypothetical protein
VKSEVERYRCKLSQHDRGTEEVSTREVGHRLTLIRLVLSGFSFSFIQHIACALRNFEAGLTIVVDIGVTMRQSNLTLHKSMSLVGDHRAATQGGDQGRLLWSLLVPSPCSLRPVCPTGNVDQPIRSGTLASVPESGCCGTLRARDQALEQCASIAGIKGVKLPTADRGLVYEFRLSAVLLRTETGNQLEGC